MTDRYFYNLLENCCRHRHYFYYYCYIIPHTNIKTPEIHSQLLDDTNKQSDPVSLKLSAQNTIDAYPHDWIHVYIDGSAQNATYDAGFGASFSILMEHAINFSMHAERCAQTMKQRLWQLNQA
ncbi:hypothetical protein BsWGS_19517 [Bradybaena similaris]